MISGIETTNSSRRLCQKDLQELCAPNLYKSSKSTKAQSQTSKREKRLRGQGRIYNQDEHEDSTSCSSEDDNNDSFENPKSKHTTGRGWKIARRSLNDGTLLLTANGVRDRPKRTQQSVRQKIVDEFRDGMTFSVQFCLMSILLYLLVSVAMYSWIFEPSWTMIDSCYFAVTTLTTCGFGDLYPTNRASVIFTCFYAITGVAFLGMLLGALGNRLIEKHQVMIKEAEAANTEEVMKLFGSMPHERHTSSFNSSVHSWTSSPGTTSRDFLKRLGIQLCGGGTWNWRRFAWMCFTAFSLIGFVAYRAGWDALSTMYYVITTASTIGYGNLTPETQMQRLAAVIYIPLVCLIMGHWLGYVANVIIELQSSRFRKKRLDRRELTQDDLDAMDITGDGAVTWAEFLEFMLVAMDKVDYELIDELQTYFRQLDLDETGELSRDDLVEAARRKLHLVWRKLELARYKRRVMNLAKLGCPHKFDTKKEEKHRTLVDFMQFSMRNFDGILSNFDESGNGTDTSDEEGHPFLRTESSGLKTYKMNHRIHQSHRNSYDSVSSSRGAMERFSNSSRPSSSNHRVSFSFKKNNALEIGMGDDEHEMTASSRMPRKGVRHTRRGMVAHSVPIHPPPRAVKMPRDFLHGDLPEL